MRAVVFLLASLGLAGQESGDLIDRLILERATRDRVPVATLSGDSEFIRRVYLDLHGRLPAPSIVTAFLADKDPAKRQKLIDSLFPEKPVPGMRSLKEHPFLDRWTYFFNDLFRNGQLLEEGINTFHDWIYKCLLLNIPYDQMVREMITASAISTWTNGPANFLARNRVFEGDGYQMNHEDTADEIAITTSKVFLGVSLECVSCHDGAGHLEKVSLWHSKVKRADVWRQASFFGKTYISPEFGRTPQFIVNDTRKGYDTTTVSALRPKRYKADLTPAFILGEGRALEGESPRAAYARLLTGHRQFARATVNLIWWELMGVGIVANPFDFDLARQDPNNPPPAPWTIQPSHPELLDALAEDFEKTGYDLQRLIRMIVSSQAYQRSSEFAGEWKPQYDSYFTRRQTRRLSAEQLYDAMSDLTRNPAEFKVTYSAKKTPLVIQTHSPQDIDKSDRKTYLLLQAFGQCDRYEAQATRRASMVQAAMLLNDRTVQAKLSIAEQNTWLKVPVAERVDQVFLTALSRLPSANERAAALDLLGDGANAARMEDLLWAMINRLDFLFY